MKREKEVIMAKGRTKAENNIASSNIVNLNELSRPIGYLRTDIAELNDKLGGLPVCMCHIGAKEGVGKTTVFLQAGITALKYLPKEKKMLFVDFENRGNTQLYKSMCDEYGVDYSRFLFKRPLSGQDGLKEIETLMVDKNTVIIMVDSVKTVISEKNIEKSITENAAAMAGPKLLNDFLEKNINNFPNHLCLLWIDHLKATATPGSFFSSNETKSGATVKFLSSWRVFLGRDSKGKIKHSNSDGDEITDGHHLYFDVKKTTVSPMIKIKNLVFYNGRGITSNIYTFKKAYEYGFLEKREANKTTKEKAGIYYIDIKGKAWFIGKTKSEKRAWCLLNKKTHMQEIKNRIYEEGRKIFKELMSNGFNFYDSEFNF